MTRVAFTLLAWSLLAASSAAQSIEEVFVHAPPSAQTFADARASDPRSAVISRVAVGVRVDAVFDRPQGPARAILLNLGAESWTAEFERLELNAVGFRSWIGRIPSVSESHVVLTERDGVISGLITTPHSTYQIRTAADGLAQSLEQVDLARLPAEKEPLIADHARPSPPRATAADAMSDGSTVDVLIVYTPAARSRLGGTPQAQALASQIIADTNSAFVRSGVAARVRLAGAHELPITEAPSMETDLRRVRDAADARFLRDAYQADLVQLLVSSPDLSTCGVAYLFANDAIDFDAYSVADVTCGAQFTPTHELAHNFGSHHAPEDGAAGALFPYSYALKDPARGFRTIMAYDCPGTPCPRVPIFSNPGIWQNGGPAGSSVQHNARSLSEAAPFVANFRRSANAGTVAPPGPPSGLSTVVEGNHVTVSWSAAQGGLATGFVLQVGSSPGSSNVFNASVGNVTSAAGAVPAGAYFWRVLAINSTGQSPPSAEAQFAVGCEVPSAPGNFNFAVAGQIVTLNWSPGAGAPSTYVIEAGSSPSLANLLASDVGPQTSLVTAAPSGTYYVRVRARNACGLSAPSNEQTIVVP